MVKLRKIPPYQLTSAVAIVIIYLTLLPDPFGEEELPLFPGADKLAHSCMFGGLALTYFYERYRADRPFERKGALTASAMVSAFGIVIEFVQSAMGLGRSGDIFDAIADIFGAFAAIPVYYYLHRIYIIVKNGTKK